MWWVRLVPLRVISAYPEITPKAEQNFNFQNAYLVSMKNRLLIYAVMY